ncbi:BON domain-containing protein [Polynucleobacter sphagniphilus]|jgi:osmotically-inducible protein OsmY|uniref:Osmotically-inducible protein OsmY n=1 Tax=Polynucleobacter sphagniphilus TaxID=1743169 RepID=A0AA43MAT7_9BURK|nr:BON domain-containing protein [Polynucleobacter sphagniphilus]MDH6153756.1 osmotically-inducible protein OsmY [Polynucleobacter sphagniphilus]MDH6242349.1 osmotically-inducible protein OsmY [Polynucleobacter sphagniphilus]MDH6249059.1 osmotically-inducible protein OsmY [Polynucleobacter sphagniphilus]MDH6299137.1 osmotically-inducible protein OsmY [Polynucleobacter sphagniphilus]MDH6302511.1 osmotically-inducible protein OsmY [Polynucleobacter sphagniphilus]
MFIKSITKFVIASSCISLLSACAVVAVGGVTAGATIMADRRTPAVQAIDKGIELQAENALDKRFGDKANINVTSFNQKVLLTGEVQDDGIKNEAGDYVKSMKNARSSFNELVVGPISSYTARASDSYLESKIKTQMIFTDQLPSNSMAIVAEGGNVYLMGILTQNEAALAKKVASNTNGVKEVFAYFDIISDAEKNRLEKQGKADDTQPSSPPVNK